jgi:hypothetical protein
VVAWLAVMILPLGAISYRARSQLQEAIEQAKIEHARVAAEWDAKVAAAPTPLEQARAHLDAAAALFEESQLDDVTRHVEAAAPLLTPADRELEATRQLLLGKLAATHDEDEPAPHGAESARHLQRALDLREQLFGPESLEVAEVLEATPRSDTSDRAAALVRDLRLTSIYERAFAGDPEAFAEKLDVALQEEAFVRIDAGDLERGEAALQRAAEVAGHARGEQTPGLESAALAILSDFYFDHQRYPEVRAVLARRAKLDLAASGPGRIGMDVYVENDRCWLEYWESNFAGARDCFSGLHARVLTALGSNTNGRITSLPYLIDQLAATARAGDDAEVRRLLAEARSSPADRESPVAFDQYAAMLLRSNETSDSFDPRGEFRRRADERRRVLGPILSPAEARETP